MYIDNEELYLKGTRINNIIYLNVSGKLNMYNYTELRFKVDYYINDGYNNFIFNIDKLEYIDSSGIGYLINLNKTIKALKGILKFTKPNDYIKNIFEVIKLNKIFNIIE